MQLKRNERNDKMKITKTVEITYNCCDVKGCIKETTRECPCCRKDICSEHMISTYDLGTWGNRLLFAINNVDYRGEIYKSCCITCFDIVNNMLETLIYETNMKYYNKETRR